MPISGDIRDSCATKILAVCSLSKIVVFVFQMRCDIVAAKSLFENIVFFSRL